MTPTPHDALFKATYSDPARAAAHLASVLPAGLVARLDLDTLEVLPGSFIDPELAQSASDLRFGAVSDAVKFRLNAATTDDLSDWTRRFFRANSPEELVGLDG